MTSTISQSADDSDVQKLRLRGRVALAELIDTHRQRLRKSIDTHLDPRLAVRLDGSDIIQETFIEAASRMEGYLERPNVPVFVWLRFLAHQVVTERHRKHFGTQKRDLGREVAGGNNAMEKLCNVLTESMVSPHSAIARNELGERMRKLIGQLSANDQEILTMMHLESMTLSEVSAVLELPAETTRKRHFRAMKRLRTLIEDMEGSLE